MLKNNLLAKSVRFALIAGAATAALTTAPVFAAEKEEVERIEVTGSRIKRTDIEGPLPVQIFDKAEIQSSGAQTLTDFLFQSNFAGPGLSTENATLSQGAGSASFDARGFGSSYTVFLINGRRLPGKATGGSASPDLNSLPLAAVERVEFLATGASAIYGADAISGVINIITKKDFEGLSVKAQYGAAFEHGDGGRTSFEVVGGTSSENSSTIIAFDYFKQQKVNAGDRPFISSATSSVTGQDGRSPTGLPGTWLEADFSNSFPVEGCPERSVRNATVAGEGTECAYDFAPLYQAVPVSERFNLFVKHDQQISDDFSAFIETRYSRAATKVRNGAAPGFFAVSADAPENPFGRNMFMIRRTVDAGPRSRDAVNTTFNIATGFEYNLSEEHVIDGYYTKSWVNNNQLGKSGNISKEGFSAAVDAGVISLINNNSADLWTLEPHTGDNGEDYWIAIPTHRQGELTEQVAHVGVSGNFDLADGAGYYVGVEQRKETYFDYTDIAQIQGDVAGGAASFGIGDRNIKSVFGEFSISPVEMLELSAALRWDDITTSISDIGSETTYKLAASLRPTDNLLLRVSQATGFKAPTLGNLFLGESFGVTSATDPKACAADPTQCSDREVRSKSGGNKELLAETSESFNVGVSWEIIKDLSLTLDYWDIKVEGKIGSLSVQEILNNEDQYGDLINRVGNNLYHPDAFVESNLQNLSEQSGKGVDIDTSYRFDLGHGTASLGLRSSYLLEMNRQSSAVQPLCDDAGTTSEPEWRSNLTAAWETSDYGANVTARYVGETVDHAGGKISGTCGFQNEAEEVDSYMQVNIQGFYYLSTGTKLTAGIRNIFNEEPSYSSQAGGGWPWYDQALFDNMGTYGYVSFEHKF